MEFKDKLKSLRASKNISQQALADAIYVSRSAVAKWENGLGCPSPDSLEALARYFEVEPDFFRTEEPETVIASKNLRILWLRRILTVLSCLLALCFGILVFHLLTTVTARDVQGLARQTADYFDCDSLQVLETARRGDFLAALCRTSAGQLCMGVFERDPIFPDRWQCSGGKPRFSPGELCSWNYGSPRQGAVLIFCGAELPDRIAYYTFENAGISYTCPVREGTVLDIFIILDSMNISGYPVPLNDQKQPLP